MKINERTLAHYALSEGFDKEGTLWKRGEVNKNFQKRHFVLKGNLLFYFEKKGDKEPVGLIILEGCTVELAEEEQEKFALKIAFHGEGRRSYILGTESHELLEEWMKLLAQASYDYIKLMVLELQQQLQEFEESERLGVNHSSTNSAPSIRSNPFNSTLEKSYKKKDSSTKTWQSIHCEYGRKISRDRHAWCQKKIAEDEVVDIKNNEPLIVNI